MRGSLYGILSVLSMCFIVSSILLLISGPIYGHEVSKYRKTDCTIENVYVESYDCSGARNIGVCDNGCYIYFGVRYKNISSYLVYCDIGGENPCHSALEKYYDNPKYTIGDTLDCYYNDDNRFRVIRDLYLADKRAYYFMVISGGICLTLLFGAILIIFLIMIKKYTCKYNNSNEIRNTQDV